MKSANSRYVKRTLAIAIMAACTSLAVQAKEPTEINKNVLAQVMTLHGLDEDSAITRLAAEEAAADLYHRIRSMDLPGYAGAWFDADSSKLHVALSDSSQSGLLERFGVVPVSVNWSLEELGAVQADIMKDTRLVESGLLRSVHVDYMQNRVAVGTTPGNVIAVRERLVRHADQIDVYEGGELPEFSSNVRGADGTRNYTFEQNPLGTGYYPCSVGASTENGFYTAGHCGRTGYDIRWAATYAPLGLVGDSALPDYSSLGDIGWVSILSGWTSVSQINGYSDGIINVPAQWSGTRSAPIGTTVCRYGQTSNGPHCGTITSKGQNLHFPIGWVANVTEVAGSCSNDGDSGGSWIAASSNQIQGTNIGPTTGNTCPNNPPAPGTGAFFQPITSHISEYASAAGSLLTTHGAAAPTVSGFSCPDMTLSGGGMYYCTYSHYNSQGVTAANWSVIGPLLLPIIQSESVVIGNCFSQPEVSVSLTVTNPYGNSYAQVTFACPDGPIPP